MKKKPGLLWTTLIMVILIGVFVILPNAKELASDGSIWIYFGVLAVVLASIIYTSTQKQ